MEASRMVLLVDGCGCYATSQIIRMTPEAFDYAAHFYEYANGDTGTVCAGCGRRITRKLTVQDEPHDYPLSR